MCQNMPTAEEIKSLKEETIKMIDQLLDKAQMKRWMDEKTFFEDMIKYGQSEQAVEDILSEFRLHDGKEMSIEDIKSNLKKITEVAEQLLNIRFGYD